MQRNTKVQVQNLRKCLEPVFTSDTGRHSEEVVIPSTGHCAAVALIANIMFKGQLISATVQKESHWFNRIEIDGLWYDVDLTGDQFGFPPVQIKTAQRLYGKSKVRSWKEVTWETAVRAYILAERADLI